MTNIKERTIISIHERHIKYELYYYTGSLDFPCDFCNSQSYANFHIKVKGELTVVCEKCLAKVKKICTDRSVHEMEADK